MSQTNEWDIGPDLDKIEIPDEDYIIHPDEVGDADPDELYADVLEAVPEMTHSYQTKDGAILAPILNQHDFDSWRERALQAVIKGGTPPTPTELTLKRYVLAGLSTFTIESTKTQTRFTFRVISDDNASETEDPRWYVKVLVGNENTNDYQYLGTIFRNRDGENYYHGKKSTVKPTAPSAIAFQWFWTHIDNLPNNINFYKSLNCCVCGALLTTPESIARNMGPSCAKKMGLIPSGGQHEGVQGDEYKPTKQTKETPQEQIQRIVEKHQGEQNV